MNKKTKIAFGKISISSASASTSNPEPSISGFGTFGKDNAQTKDGSDKDSTSDEVTEVEKALGFTSFGKKSKNFDLEKLVKESHQLASERNKKQLEKLSLEHKTQVELNEKIQLESMTKEAEENSDDDLIGPPIPDSLGTQSDDEADEEEIDGYGLPITSELTLQHGSKTISGLAIDPAGSRMVSGAIDYDVKYWDFQGMDLLREPFRTFRPADGYPIYSLEYSCTGDKVLVVSGSCQAKVYDRDGGEVYECTLGDMYLHDMAKTKGHISALTDGKWHPKLKEEFMTSARDGTCRLWDIYKPLSQKQVIKPRAQSGLKALPTACAYSRDGLLVAAACNDGSIQMWDHRRSFVNTSLVTRTAHQKGTDTCCIVFSYDNKQYASRGGDDSLKLWDLRNNKKCIHEISNLYNRFDFTDCIFSPNDQTIITGTSLEKGSTNNTVKFYDKNTFNLVKEIDMGPKHITRLIWHPKLNQIIVGCGDGGIVLMYDKEKSHNGALLVAGKNKKRAKHSEIVLSKQILTPHALPMFREDRHKSTGKQEEKDRKDPQRSRQPELPLGKAGSGGRVSTGGSTLSSYIIRNMGILNKVKEEENPRDALMRHAKEASENPYWISPAYAKTQPKTIFENSEKEEPPTKKQKVEE